MEILPGVLRPYYIKSKGMTEGTYVRVFGTTRPVEGYVLKELILEGQNRYYDSEPYRGMSLTDAEIEKLCKSMKEGYYKPRNPAIARAFAYMKIIEKWGTGIPRAFRECKEHGLPEPELIEFDGDFRVNMYRKVNGEFGVNDKTIQTTQTHQTTQSNTLGLSEDDKAILMIIHDKPTMTQKEYALELGWTVDRVKYYLRKMKTQQIISRVGSSHNGYWVLLKDSII